MDPGGGGGGGPGPTGRRAPAGAGGGGGDPGIASLQVDVLAAVGLLSLHLDHHQLAHILCLQLPDPCGSTAPFVGACYCKCYCRTLALKDP